MGKKAIEVLQKTIDKINNLIREGKVVIEHEDKTRDYPKGEYDPKEVG